VRILMQACTHNGSQRKAASVLDKSVQATRSQAIGNKRNALKSVGGTEQ